MKHKPPAIPTALQSQSALKSSFWEICRDRYKRPDGSIGEYIWAKSPRGAVITILRNPRRELLLIKLYRYPVKRWLWEFVAGGVEPGQTPEQFAVRGSREEVGVRIPTARLLGSFVPLTGLTGGSKFYVCFAEIPAIAAGDLKLQRDEYIAEARFLNDEQLANAVAAGEIEAGGALTALSMYWAHIKAGLIAP